VANSKSFNLNKKFKQLDGKPPRGLLVLSEATRCSEAIAGKLGLTKPGLMLKLSSPFARGCS